MTPTSDQLLGIARALIPGLVAALSHWGIGTDAQNTALLTAVATGVVAAWSTWSNSKTKMIQSVNLADNGVKVVADTSSATTVNTALK
jgi:hypothetical protein